MKYKNPIIPGFYPDPSICRVGEDYYLATSSFEYFPGVPIFHSKDLINWTQIGHCLTRKSQLNLDGVQSSDGIYAPTLRYNNGIFYMITTNVNGTGHFYVYTENPYGEWSDPIFVKGTGFDPDLFFDLDGKVYFTREDIQGYGIRQWEIDIKTGELIGEEKLIWAGFEDKLCEAPHIYFINGYYYLLVAEGGTHRGHMIVIARSKNVSGPYEGCPNNPILTHRCDVLNWIQATGHGDLVQAADGNWWIVFLAIRQINKWHHLGRETFLAPVTWSEDGWPIINNGKSISIDMNADNGLDMPKQNQEKRNYYGNDDIPLYYNYRGNVKEEFIRYMKKDNSFQIKLSSENLNDVFCPTFIGRRQCHFKCEVDTTLEFQPLNDGEEAGLTVLMNENHHYEICIIKNLQKTIIVRKTIGKLSTIVAKQDINDDIVTLKIRADENKYYFGYEIKEEGIETFADGETKYLSTEVAGGFTGVYFGMYATSNGRVSDNKAIFNGIKYNKISS